MYTIPEVAIILRVSNDTVRRMITSQKITAIKVGWVWRIKEDALDDYLESRTFKAKRKKIAV